MDRRFDKLLVLDLDETLIYATMFSLPRPPDFRVGLSNVWRRPGVGRFLRTCLEWFRVGVWTSATAPYADEVIGHLVGDPRQLAFVFTRDHCFRRQAESSAMRRDEGGAIARTEPASFVARGMGPGEIRVKDLGLLLECGHAAETIIVVDDSPESWVGHGENVVAVSQYKGEPDDRELDLLLPFLESLGEAENVRVVAKTGWRKQSHPS